MKICSEIFLYCLLCKTQPQLSHSIIFRWTKLRIAMIPHTVVLEPFTECFVASLLLSWSCAHFFGWNVLLVLGSRVLLWFFFDYILYSCLEVSSRSCKFISGLQALCHIYVSLLPLHFHSLEQLSEMVFSDVSYNAVEKN